MSKQKQNALNFCLGCLASFLIFGKAPFSVIAQDDKPAAATESAAKVGDELDGASLIQATREGNLAKVKSALAAGVDVNSTTDYGATALFFACDRGNLEIVEVLLDNGADPNIKDTFYKATPMTWAQSKGHKEIIIRLLKNGGKGADAALIRAIASKDFEFARMILEANVVSEKGLLNARDSALEIKDSKEQSKLLKLFEALKLPEPSKPMELTPEILKRYAGKYQGDRFFVVVEASETGLKLGFNDDAKSAVKFTSENEFSMGAFTFRFEIKDDVIVALYAITEANEFKLLPSKTEIKSEPGEKAAETKNQPPTMPETDKEDSPEFGPSSAQSHQADLAISSPNWPGFRGNGSRGVADGQNPPIQWGVTNDEDDQPSENLKWKASRARFGFVLSDNLGRRDLSYDGRSAGKRKWRARSQNRTLWRCGLDRR